MLISLVQMCGLDVIIFFRNIVTIFFIDLYRPYDHLLTG